MVLVCWVVLTVWTCNALSVLKKSRQKIGPKCYLQVCGAKSIYSKEPCRGLRL